MKKRLPLIGCALILTAGVVLVGSGLFPLAKARLAQVLLETAWQKTLAGDGHAAPWPWADFRPVAALTFPEHHYRAIVVTGASGTSLAFAPGLLDGTPLPGDRGNSVVFAHKETHFAVLEQVTIGDTIVVTDRRGIETTYRVYATRVTKCDDKTILRPSRENRLTLITCYPFYSVLPGPERYVAMAEAPPG